MSNALLARIEADDRAHDLRVLADELRSRLFVLEGRDDPHSRLLRAMIVQDRIWLLTRAKSYRAFGDSIVDGRVPDLPEPIKGQTFKDWTQRMSDVIHVRSNESVA